MVIISGVESVSVLSVLMSSQLWMVRVYHCDKISLFQIDNITMPPPLHDRSGRHLHHAVIDWRLLRSRFEAENCESIIIEHQQQQPPGLHNQQLDFLYNRLDNLKQSMVEKQSCLANVSDE